jgi:hypothetical protein
MAAAIPIVCELTDKELQKRRAEYLDRLAAVLSETTELENGFRYSFTMHDGLLKRLGEVVDLERKCCPFIDFKISAMSGENHVTLDMTGPDGTKEAIESLFGWN